MNKVKIIKLLKVHQAVMSKCLRSKLNQMKAIIEIFHLSKGNYKLNNQKRSLKLKIQINKNSLVI